MQRRAGFRISYLLALSGFFLTWLALYRLAARPEFFESDRLYHFALMRKLLAQGDLVLRSWREVPLLGWDRYFSDKEFLYHLFLWLPAHWAGEAGIVAATLLLSACIFWLPVILFPKHRWFALAISFFLVAGNPHVLFRFALVRPHELAVLLFLLTVLSFWRRKPWLAAASAFLFCWAYHAFYLLLAWIALWLLVAVALRWLRISAGYLGWREAVYAAGGLLAGLLTHPYFPSNLVRGIQHLAIALHASALSRLHMRMGNELLPLPFWGFLREFVPALLVAGISAFLSFRRRLSAEERQVELALLLLLALLWLGSLSSPRSAEYALPLTAIFAALIWSRERAIFRANLLVALAIYALPMNWISWEYLRWPGNYNSPPPAFVAEVLAPVPLTEKVRIYHTNWGLGPYILYFRPQAEIIDLLDPTFLAMQDPQKTLLQYNLMEGNIAQPGAAIRREFGADYVLAETSPLVAQLRNSADAEFLGNSRDNFLFLFRLKGK